MFTTAPSCLSAHYLVLYILRSSSSAIGYVPLDVYDDGGEHLFVKLSGTSELLYSLLHSGGEGGCESMDEVRSLNVYVADDGGVTTS